MDNSKTTKQHPLQAKEVKTLFVAALLAMLALAGTDIHLASLPFIMKSLGTTKSMMQQSISIYFLGMGICTFFWGPFSDKHGR